MKQLGVNTFSVKELLHDDFEGTMRKLKEIGFTCIEPMVTFTQNSGMSEEEVIERLKQVKFDGLVWPSNFAKERIQWIRNEGFDVYGTHLGLRMAPGDKNGLVSYIKEFVQETNLSFVVYSPQKDTIEAIKEDVEFLKELVSALKDTSCMVLFHNHSEEMKEDHGDTPFDYLLREIPDIKIELDVGWVQMAKKDVIAVMEQYKERIVLIHFKDIQEGIALDNRAELFTAIGEGSIPLDAIIQKAKQLHLINPEYIIDQDESSKGDILRDLEVGYQNIKESFAKES